jgi:hypothetical protein
MKSGESCFESFTTVPEFHGFYEILSDKKIVSKFAMQEEVGESGNVHLQGCLEFKTKKRPMSVFKNDKIHWEKCRSWKHSVAYCTDEDKRAVGGKMWAFPKPPRKIKKMSYERLNDKQKEIADLFLDEPDEFVRSINWFWESEGNWGKSVLCRYFIDERNALVVQGANKDILCGLASWIDKNGEAPEIVVFDVPRTNCGHVSYQAIESILNGFCFSGKYESGMLRFNPPHLIVFANEEPEYSKCSEDRWNVIKLT